MIRYAPFRGEVKIRPMLGQSQPPGSKLSYSQVKNIKDGLDLAVKAILMNPSAPCVAGLDKNKLISIQTMLSQIIGGGGHDSTYNLSPDQLDIIDQALRCGDELTGGAITHSSSAGPSLLPLAIPALIVAASIGVSAYHGYKRNKSTGWAVWWGFMGLLLPVITPAVAIAQGYGKREK